MLRLRALAAGLQVKIACSTHYIRKDYLSDRQLLHCIRSYGRSFSEALAVEESENESIPEFPVPDPELSEVIIAVPRAGEGKIIAKKERRAGRVPGVVYSLEDGEHGGHKQLISLEAKQLARLLKRIGYSFFHSRTFELEVREEMNSEVVISRERVLPRWVHLHAGTDALLNATFIRAPPEAKIKVDVPLVFRGKDACPGIKRGGYLNTIKRIVRLKCPADLIPPYVEVNLGEMDTRAKVLLRDLKFHPSIRLVDADDSLPVCKIMGTRFIEGGPRGAAEGGKEKSKEKAGKDKK
ncbi:hypothetical protein KP509_10G035800 [Ceratopteris richardii]|uniref:50S ribosomal protein L25 n=1 Tax=Ceratopteris richardii TaxID=49495 RepID=A0A8T2TUC4_CERRI|nr:hypothetical protein KP509_10G035800 [Ceratopteris richardii]